jgi:photosystem II stability/assembly factor-like uncharacterized protein
MKKTITILVFLFISEGILIAQVGEMLTRIQSDSFNYFTVIKRIDSLITNTQKIDSLDSDGIKSYRRWRWFWDDRINTRNGSQNDLFDAEDEYKKINYGNDCNCGMKWESLGPDYSSERIVINGTKQNVGLVNCVRPAPDYIVDTTILTNKTIYAGSNSSGLFVTYDNGKNWQCITDDIKSPGLSVTSIVFVPNGQNYDIIIGGGMSRYGKYYGAGIFRLNHNATSWVELGKIPGISYPHISGVWIDPDSSNILYAAVMNKLFRSKNGGISWETNPILEVPLAGGGSREITSLEFLPINTNHAFVSVKGNGTKKSGLYKTNSIRSCSSNQWVDLATNFYDNERLEIATSASDSNALWVVYSFVKLDWDSVHPEYTLILKTNDEGNTWDTLKLYHKTYGYIFKKCDIWRMGIEISPIDSNLIMVEDYTVSTSFNNGAGFFSLIYVPSNFDNYHCDTRSLEIFADSMGNSFAIAGNDGGVSITYDFINWKDISGTGLNIKQCLSFYNSEKYPYYITIGTFDNGFSLLPGEKNDEWLCDIVGDVFGTGYNYMAPDFNNIFFVEFQMNRVMNRDSGFTSYSIAHYDSSNISIGYGGPVSPLTISNFNPKVSFTAVNNNRKLYMSVDGGKYYNTIYDFKQNGDTLISPIRIIEQSKTDSNLLLVGFYGATYNKTGNGIDKKIMKSTNGGLSWTNLTDSISDLIAYHSISDIEIDNNDNSIIYISLNNYNSSPVDNNYIYRSTDGGLSWKKFGDSLPNIPVNCIESLSGSTTHEVFIGTDFGVFYRSDLTNGWQKINGNLPAVIVTEIRAINSINKLFISTFGRGLWEADLPCVNLGSTLDINGFTVWGKYVYSNNIVIHSGATLTIKGNLIMDNGASITVKKGGKLIIDGGIITSRCGMWQGVIVEGDPNISQFPVSNQGCIFMKNGAKIENAVIAVHVISPPPSLTQPYSPEGGGIVRVNNSYFVNNQYGIVMEPYKYVNNNGYVLPNQSYIRNSKFFSNDKLNDSTLFPKYFVYLNNIEKIEISASIFENSFMNNFNKTNHGSGIYAFNSSFFVSEHNSDSCKFINLEYGIKSLANKANLINNINKSLFRNNENAVYFNAVDNAKLTRCSFILDDANGYGLYLDNCTHYTIEQNDFYAPSSTLLALAGMVINNSGSDANEVYNNYFHNFPAAMLAQHDNWGGTPMKGLSIKCNDFNNCMQDIAITESYNYTGKTGISAYQGANVDNKSLAGNTFSHKGYSTYFGTNPYSDYNNEKGIIISKYYHHDGTVNDAWVPKYYTYGDPTTGIPLAQTQIVPDSSSNYPYIKSKSCPDRQNTGSGSSIIVLYDSLNAKQVQLNSAKLTLSIYEDGGNPELNEEVATAYPWETWQYYNELMLASPYLSDETLIEAINNTDLLPTNLLKLILLANPQCSRSEEVMDVLYARIPVMSQADIDQILQKQGDSSPIDELKANVNYYTHERMRYATQIEYYYLTDTVNDYAMDSLINFLGREANVNAKYRLAFLYMQKKEYDLAHNTLNDIDNIFELNERETKEKAAFDIYFGIIDTMDQYKLSYGQLNESQKQSLQNLAAGIFLPSAYARSMLLQYDSSYSYTEPVIFPTISSSRLQRPKNNNSNKESIIKIYPNPAYDYISVDYKLENGNGRIEIIDNIGRVLLYKTITNLSGTEVISLDRLSPGVYKLLFYSDNILIETKQFSKVK